MVHYIYRVCYVSPYYDENKPVKGVPVVHAAIG